MVRQAHHEVDEPMQTILILSLSNLILSLSNLILSLSKDEGRRTDGLP
jgi:hypothetical protein